MSHSRDKVQSEEKKVTVIGHPISHTKSPLIHNYFINKFGLNASYSKHDISSDEELKQFVSMVKAEEWGGFNITIPHKQAIIPFLDVIDESVELIGACNTVVINDQKLFGYNTDAEGFYYPINNNSFSKVIVFGNGGASKAVLFQLCKVGYKDICLVARDHQKSVQYIKRLEKSFDLNMKTIGFNDLKADDLDDHALIINSTSVGMNASDVPFEIVKYTNESHTFYDLIYNPWETEMIKMSKKNGAKVINGAYMLAHQASLAFKLFFECDADTEKMHELIYNDVSND